jgi:hypothetical protein
LKICPDRINTLHLKPVYRTHRIFLWLPEYFRTMNPDTNILLYKGPVQVDYSRMTHIREILYPTTWIRGYVEKRVKNGFLTLTGRIKNKPCWASFSHFFIPETRFHGN